MEGKAEAEPGQVGEQAVDGGDGRVGKGGPRTAEQMNGEPSRLSLRVSAAEPDSLDPVLPRPDRLQSCIGV